MGLDSRHSYDRELVDNFSDDTDQPIPAANDPLLYNPNINSPLHTVDDTRIAVREDAEVAEPRLCRICQSGEDESDDDDAMSDEEVDLVSSEPYHDTIHDTHHSKTKRVYAKNPLIKPCKCKGRLARSFFLFFFSQRNVACLLFGLAKATFLQYDVRTFGLS